MTNFLVRVSYEYPCQAVSAEDALTTVPYVIKGRFVGFHGQGMAEILDASTKEVKLKAELKPVKE